MEDFGFNRVITLYEKLAADPTIWFIVAIVALSAIILFVIKIDGTSEDEKKPRKKNISTEKITASSDDNGVNSQDALNTVKALIKERDALKVFVDVERKSMQERLEKLGKENESLGAALERAIKIQNETNENRDKVSHELEMKTEEYKELEVKNKSLENKVKVFDDKVVLWGKFLEKKETFTLPAEKALYLIQNFDRYNFFSSESGEVVFKPIVDNVIEAHHAGVKKTADTQQFIEAETTASMNPVDPSDKRPYAYLGKSIADRIENGVTYNEELPDGSFKVHSHQGYTVLKDSALVKTHNYSKSAKVKEQKQADKEKHKEQAKKDHQDVAKEIESKAVGAKQQDKAKEPAKDQKSSKTAEEQKAEPTEQEQENLEKVKAAIADKINISSLDVDKDTPAKEHADKVEDERSQKRYPVDKLSSVIAGEEPGGCAAALSNFANELIETAKKENVPMIVVGENGCFIDTQLLLLVLIKHSEDPEKFMKRFLISSGELDFSSVNNLLAEVDDSLAKSECAHPIEMSAAGRWGYTCGFEHEGVYIKAPMLTLNKEAASFKVLEERAVEVLHLSKSPGTVRKRFNSAENTLYTAENEILRERLEAAYS